MLRWLATIAIVALLALDLGIARIPIALRGNEALARADIAGAVGKVGEMLPDLGLRDLDGRPFQLAELRGHRVLLIFERSVDW